MIDPIKTLYNLIDDFTHSRMYIRQFCDIFSYTYDFDVKKENLSEVEKKLFSELSFVCYCYTDSKEDIKICPQYHFSAEQVVEKVQEVCRALGLPY